MMRIRGNVHHHHSRMILLFRRAKPASLGVVAAAVLGATFALGPGAPADAQSSNDSMNETSTSTSTSRSDQAQSQAQAQAESQSPSSSSPSKSEHDVSAGPLAGPKIDPGPRAPAVSMGFGRDARGPRGGIDSNVKLRIYRRVLGGLELSEAQRDQRRAIHERYAARTEAYLETHREELRALREIIRRHRGLSMEAKRRRVRSAAPAQREGRLGPREVKSKSTRRAPHDAITDRTERRPEKRAAEFRRAQQRLRAINANKPSADPYLVEMYDLLTPAQQEAFDQEIEMIHDRRAERRMKAGRRPMMVPMPARDGGERATFADQRRAFIERLLESDEANLTERERRVLERLRERWEKDGQPPWRRERNHDRQRDRRGRVPVPPHVDEIEIDDEKRGDSSSGDG